MQPAHPLTFDRYALDLPNEQLWQDGQVISLTSKVFAVLQYLVEHTGQLVTKAELFDTLWPETAVSDGALMFCIVELRKALSDDAKAPRFIETVHRRGYRFLPTVTTQPVVSSQSQLPSPYHPTLSISCGWQRSRTRPTSPVVRESTQRRASDCLRDGRAGDWEDHAR